MRSNDHEEQLHHTPSGLDQPFIYCVRRKVPS